MLCNWNKLGNLYRYSIELITGLVAENWGYTGLRYGLCPMESRARGEE